MKPSFAADDINQAVASLLVFLESSPAAFEDSDEMQDLKSAVLGSSDKYSRKARQADVKSPR